MAEINTKHVSINVEKAFALSADIVRTIIGKPVADRQQADAETALLLAYVDIALGPRQYPLVSRDVRNQLVVIRGAKALCAVIEEVGRLTEAEVQMEAVGPGRIVS